MSGTIITFSKIPTTLTPFIKNIKIGAVPKLAQIVGVKYSFQNLLCKNQPFFFFLSFFKPSIFCNLQEKSSVIFWNNTIPIIALKLSNNPTSYIRLKGLKSRMSTNAYFIALQTDTSLHRNKAISVRHPIIAALTTLLSPPQIIA